MNRTIILSGDIRSGKTTALQEFSDHHECSGALMPDIDGRRHFHLLGAEPKLLPAQATEDEKEDCIEVGRFRFYRSAFEMANNSIVNAVDQKASWIIIDEIGKLELKGEGLMRGFDYAMQNKDEESILLITVRSSLLIDIMTQYRLADALVIDIADFRASIGELP